MRSLANAVAPKLVDGVTQVGPELARVCLESIDAFLHFYDRRVGALELARQRARVRKQIHDARCRGLGDPLFARALERSFHVDDGTLPTRSELGSDQTPKFGGARGRADA